MARSISARHLLALAAALSIGACSEDGRMTSPDPKLVANDGSVAGVQNAPGDTTAGSTTGEWHLKTIRGVLHGVTGSNGLASGDTSSVSTPVIANATIEIHKFSFDISSPASGGDTSTVKLQDLGTVATVATDASGKFQYVLADPIIVKTGQPSPKITYRLTATPPAGSPFAARSDIQVFFMEQLPAGTTDLAYYLFPPKR